MNSVTRIFFASYFALFLSLSPTTVAQTKFISTYAGSVQARTADIETSDNLNFYIGGDLFNSGYSNLIIKTDARGRKHWAKKFGDFAQNGLRGIGVTRNNSVLGAGYAWDGSQWNYSITRLDSLGNFEWATKFITNGGSECWGVVENNNGDIITAGVAIDQGKSVQVTKQTANGVVLWAKTYSLPGAWLFGLSMALTTNDNYIIVGYDQSSAKPFVMRVSSDGTLLWAKLLSSSTNAAFWNSIETSDGSIFGVGSEEGQILVVKMSSDGTVVFRKLFGGSGSNYGYSVTQALDNTLIIAGTTTGFNSVGGSDFIALKIDLNGNIIWAKTYNSAESNNFEGVTAASDGGFYGAGYSTGNIGTVNLIKGDVNGDAECITQNITLTVSDIASTSINNLTLNISNIQNISPVVWTIENFEFSENYLCSKFSPSKVILDAPANNSVKLQPSNIKFAWNKNYEDLPIYKFHLQVSRTSEFSEIAIEDTSLTDTIYNAIGLTFNNNYYWRVRANNEYGWGDWSDTWSFTTIIEKPTKPVLATPKNSSKGLVHPLMLTWNPAERAAGYIVHLSADSTFSSVTFADSSLNDTSVYSFVTGLSDYTNYYWRVKGINEGGESDWSEVWSFKTLGSSYAVPLNSPADKSQNMSIAQVDLKWFKPQERIETVYKYQFQFAYDSLFTSLIVNDTTLHDTVTQVRDLEYLTTYYWRVRAYNEAGWGDWSNVWSFTTIIEKPLTPAPASPDNNITGLSQPVVLKWNRSERSSRFAVQVSDLPDFSRLVFFAGNLADTLKSLEGTQVQYNTRYYWRVKASNAGGESEWSNVLTFKTIGAPYAVSTVMPPDNSINQPADNLLFTWRKPAERTEAILNYEFQLADDPDFTDITPADALLISREVTDTTTMVSGLQNSTLYYWRVRAGNETGWGDWSGVKQFTTIIAAPEPPMLTAPANGTKGVIPPVTVSWDAAETAERYILQVSQTNDFSTLAYEQADITGTEVTVPGLLIYEQYYWRVRSVNAGGLSGWSDIYNFKTLGVPYAAYLVSPPHSSVSQPVNNLTFNWHRAAERIESLQRYHFQLAPDTLFASVTMQDSALTDTFKTVPMLQHLTTYYWRVRASNETGWGDWSENWRTTTIIDIPGQTVQSSPVNDSRGVTQPVSLVWNRAERGEWYQLQVSATSNFKPLLYDFSELNDTVQSIGELDDYKRYYWRVRSLNEAGEGEWSEIWNFTTLGQPYAVELIEPVNGAVNQPAAGLQFSWSAPPERIEAVSLYHFQLARDPFFSGDGLVASIETLTDTVYTAEALSFGTAYYWRVRASNETGWGDWSTVYTFTTIVQKPAPPVLAFPEEGIKGLVQPVLLGWQPAERAERYILQWSGRFDFEIYVWSDSFVTETAYTLPELMDYTTYYWRVKAVNIGGESEWSTPRSFTTLGSPYAVALAEPAQNAVNQSVNDLLFSWRVPQERIETVWQYQFQLSDEASFEEPMISLEQLADTMTVVSGLEHSKTYYWRVRGGNETGWGDWSEVRSFTTIIEQPETPAALLPRNGASGLIQPVTLAWSASARAAKYILQTALLPDFSQPVYTDSSLTDTLKALDGLAHYTHYFWRVKAVNTGGESDWSVIYSFRTLGSAYAVQLIEPMNNAVNLSPDELTFFWNKPEERTETVLKYQIQIAGDPSFTQIFAQQANLADTFATFGGMSYLTPYYWRVRASNEAGWGDWSEIRTFTTIIQAPAAAVLQSPSNGAKGLLQPVTLAWGEALRAERYRVEVSTDSLFGSFIYTADDLMQTAALLPMLSDYTAYYWRVMALNAGGSSPYSQVWSFKTLGSPYAVQLSVPQNNAVNQSINDLQFTWLKPQERIEAVWQYQYQLATDSLFAEPVADLEFLHDTTVTMQGLQFSTKYYWRVRAGNETGMGDWSSIYSFTTITERPAMPLLALPAPGAKGLLQPVTLNWNRSPRAETYIVQAAELPDFINTVPLTQPGADTSVQVNELNHYTWYYWRVKAVNTGGESDWSEVRSFLTLGNPYAVSLASPPQGSINLQPGIVNFSWQKAQERTETVLQYQFQLDLTPQFLAPVTETLTDTTVNIYELNYDRDYYWRVRASNQTGWGDWSDTWSFRTIVEMPGMAQLLMPLNQSKGLIQPVEAVWEEAARAERYILQIAADSLFTQITLTDSAVQYTFLMLPYLQDFTTYWWRVKGVNINGEGQWSPVWNFKTLGSPYAAELVSPANNAVNQSVNELQFTWMKPQERIEAIWQYHYQLASDSLFTEPLADLEFLHDTTVTMQGLGFSKMYYWRVRAGNETGMGDWSNIYRFTTITERPEVPLLASPLTGSSGVVQPVLLTWHSAARAEGYQLEAAGTPDFMTPVYMSPAVTDTFLTLPELGIYSQYYWRVKAVNIGGQSAWSDIWSFKTLGRSYAVQLLQPADNAVNQPVANLQFAWKRPAERIETVLKYHYQLASDAEFTSLVINDTTLTDTLFTAGGLANSSMYYWRVRALNETGWGDWSAARAFTTIIAAPEVPLLSSPVNNQKGLLNPVTAVWNSAERAAKYVLQVSAVQDFSSLVYEQNSVTDTFRVLPQLAVYTEHFWRLKSVNAGGESPWSEVRSFKLLGSPFAVTLLQPVNLASQQPAGELTFIWSKPAERTEQISRYHFMLSADSLFASLSVNDSALADTVTRIYNLMNGKEYWWKVRAGNETGWGDWSGAFRFTTIQAVPPAVVLASPVNNLKGVTNPVAVMWHPADRAASYILQVSQTTDFSTLVFADSSLADTTRLLSDLNNYSLYYWRVKGKNEGGEGAWSSIWNFRTLGQPYMVQTVLPQDDAVNLPVTGVQFAWLKPAERIEAVSGYHIELALDPAMTNIIYADTTLTDTAATAAGPLANLTSYWWRVRAKNQTGWGDWSAVRKFTTIIAQPEPAMLAFPANNAVEIRQPVMLGWMKSPRAERYILEVSDSPLFTAVIFTDSTLTDTTKLLPELSSLTVYHWRVTAVNIGGVSAASEVWNFRTLGAPAAVTLLLPENGAVQVPAAVQFAWTKASHQENVIRYWFELYADTTAQPLYADSSLTDTLTAMQLENDRTYYWKVRAGNEAGWSGFSPWSSFTTIVPLAAAPDQLSPEYLASGLDLVQQLVWAHAPYADIYHLQMATDPQFLHLVINDSTLTDTVRITDSLDYKTAYYWRLRSGNEAGYGAFSPVWRFTTMIRPILPPSDLVITPVADLKVALQWRDHSDNEEGFFILRKEGDSLSANEYALIGQVSADSVRFTDTTVTVAAGYSYLIVAFNEDTVSDGGAYAFFQITGIEERMGDIPDEYSLSQNYPNPFNPSTLIVFGLPEDAFVDIRIYDIGGSLVRVITEEELKAGTYRLRWDGRNDYGSQVPSGIYLCRMTTKNFTAVKKLMLVK